MFRVRQARWLVRNICGITLTVAIVILSCSLITVAGPPDGGEPLLRIACSNPSYTLLENAAAEYQESVARIKFEVQPVHNDWMMRQMATGYADMSVHTGPLDIFDRNTLDKAFPKHGEFEQTPIAWFTVAVVVHPGVGVRWLSTHHLGQICKGEVTNWQELGGSNREIVLVGQSMRYNSTDIIRRTTFPNQQLTDKLVEKKNKAGVVAAVKETPGAIGFFLHDWEETDGLRPLSIAPCNEKGEQTDKPAELSQAAVLEGRYPIADPLVVVFHPNAPAEAYNFFEFLKSEAVAKIAEKRRMLTEYHRQEHLGEMRLIALRAGKGTEITVAGPRNGAKLAEELAKLYVEGQDVIQVTYTGQREAAENVAALIAGEAELLFVDGDGTEFAQLSKYKPHILGRRAVGVIVHPDIRIDNLLVSDLKRIYEGEVTEWDDGAEAMKMYGPDSAGPAVEVFAQTIAAERRRIPYVSQRTIEETIKTVAGDPSAIGLVDLSEFVNQKLSADDAPTADIPVKLVPIVTLEQFKKSGSQPLDPQAIPKDYPLSRTYTLYVSPEASETTKQFVQFLTPARLKETLGKHGLIEQSTKSKNDKK